MKSARNSRLFAGRACRSIMSTAIRICTSIRRSSALLLEIGRDYGMKAMRVPYENPAASARAAGKGTFSRTAISGAFAPWAKTMRARLDRAGVASNDAQFGFHDTGRMTEELVLRQLENVEPDRVTEFYFHPATRRERNPQSNRCRPIATSKSSRRWEVRAARGAAPSRHHADRFPRLVIFSASRSTPP